MTTGNLGPQVDAASFRPRSIQLAAAGPSLLLWALLSAVTVVWFAGVGITALMGRLATGNDWRFPYLIVMGLLVLVLAGATARTLWRAWQGRSRLWWHASSFGLGIVLFILLGIVGD